MDRNRRIALSLLATAAIGWLIVAVIFLGVDPLANPGMGMTGAAALGFALGMTAAPMFWLVGYARQGQIAYRGDWARSIRRGAWVGVLVAIFVVMRLNGIFQPPIGLFLIALVLVAEVTLTAGSTRGP